MFWQKVPMKEGNNYIWTINEVELLAINSSIIHKFHNITEDMPYHGYQAPKSEIELFKSLLDETNKMLEGMGD